MKYYEIRQPYGAQYTPEIVRYLRTLPALHFNWSVFDGDGICVATDAKDTDWMRNIPADSVVTRCTVSDEVRDFLSWEREWGNDPFKVAPWKCC